MAKQYMTVYRLGTSARLTAVINHEEYAVHSLLTGKFGSAEQPTDEPWTAEEHLAAMRRLLDTASKSPSSETERIMDAARIHAEAAKSAGRTPLPVKTAPARTLPRDGDAL